MLLKPVTALALSAFISFVASSAVAAPASTSDGKAITSSVKTSHHTRRTTKKKKVAPLAYQHPAEPKTSPKVPASTSRPLELKKASDRSALHSKKGTLAATGKEVYIGGPVAHPSAVAKASKPSVDPKASVAPSGGKLASGSLHSSRSGGLHAGREPSRARSTKIDNGESGTDDHPVVIPAVAVSELVVPAKPAKPACAHEPVEFVRGQEKEAFALTRCGGGLAPLADERLSVLVRPESAARPRSIDALVKVKGAQLAPGIRRVDPGLLARVQTIADHFAKPGAPVRVSIVSGYRPNSTGSYHATAQALDFHVDGVSNEALVEFCKTLDDTGCGYYPNSSFVHVDVRAPKTGHVAWIDASGPGEAPRYVASWPPPPDPDVKIADREDPAKAEPWLPPLPGSSTSTDDHRPPAASVDEPFNLKDWE